jgi:hypothetical protein
VWWWNNKGRQKVKGKRKKTKDIKAEQNDSLNLEPCSSYLEPPALIRRRRCTDCLYCQFCSQDRCRLCWASKKKAPQKLSMAEQIALYDRINKKRGPKKKRINL